MLGVLIYYESKRIRNQSFLNVEGWRSYCMCITRKSRGKLEHFKKFTADHEL